MTTALILFLIAIYLEAGRMFLKDIYRVAIARGDIDDQDARFLTILTGAGDRFDRSEVAASYIVAITMIVLWPVALLFGWLNAKFAGDGS